MRKILLFIISVILFQGFARAQFADSFTDGNFTSNPTWTGDVALYKVNTASQLQLNSTISETAALSAANSMTPDMEWHFWIKLAFAPSDNNLARFYLTSDQADLKGPLNGYYLKFGETGSNDAIELVQQSGNIHTVICRGTDGLLAAAFTIRIKVVRAAGGSWTVYADELGGTNYKIQASGADNTFTNGSCLGVYSKFTSSNGTRFYYDDFYAGPVIVDNLPPEVVSVSLETLNNLSVIFNEPVEASSSTNVNNFSTTPGSLVPQSATQDFLDPSIIHLSYAQRFTPDIVYSLDVKNVKDLAGNVMTASQTPFSWHQAKTYDILVSEIMADPTPPVNLPETEYVELYNRSAFPVELQNWSLWLGTTEKVLPQYTLPAGGYVILCDDGSKPSLAPYGAVIDFSSFSVTNGSGIVTLKDFDGNVIHTASYAESWFQGSYKKDGGWSLELIDPLNPCGESANWAACSNADGGTPGKVNSVHASNPDLVPPSVSSVVIADPTHITVLFSESCDSSTVLNKTNYSIDNGIGNPTAIWAYSPDYNSADLTLASPLVVGVNYTITTTNTITDCAGNVIQSGNSAEFALPIPDTTPPSVISVSLEATNKLSVTFTEPVESASATMVNNYSTSPGLYVPTTAMPDPADSKIIHLTYTQYFTPDIVYSLDIINVKDLAGNAMDTTHSSFSWHQAKSYDVLINEIMSDPTPPVNLPEAEYVELYNRSSFPVDMKGWTLLLGSTKKTLPQYTLAAGEYLILCDDGAKPFFSLLGPVIDFSTFSVTNVSGTITLKDFNGNVIHAISYTDGWFLDSYKKDGGWSLELIDPMNPCGESANWAACSNADGGTPGKVNSVHASNPDLVSPALSQVKVIDPTHITIWFTESCDSAAVLNKSNYIIDNGIGNPADVWVHSPEYKIADLTLSAPLVVGVDYTLTSTNNLTDCAGNAFLTENSMHFGIPFPDTISPEVVSVSLETLNKVSITFTEPVEAASSTRVSNYSTMPGSLIPVSAAIDLFDQRMVHLVYAQRFTPDVVYSLDIVNVKDMAGNVIDTTQSPFSWHQAKTFDVLINEIMADPSPTVNLPESEYVELYNRSNFPLELKYLTLWLGTTAKPLPNYTLPAGEYVILCDDGSKPLLQPFGDVIDFSSFAVTNLSGTITLKDFDGNVIHSVSYSDGWYKGSYKKDGGWSLELIDPLNPCGEAANWTVCSNSDGGTPGTVNSVKASNPDLLAPEISRVGVHDPMHMTVWFTESCDSANLLNPANYTISDGIGNPVTVVAHNPDYKIVDLTPSSPLQINVIYTLTSTGNITDCAGNEILTGSSARLAIPAEAEENDIVINELLFDPVEDCVDFVEIFNRSAKVIDLKDLILVNYDTINNVITDYNQISGDPFLIFPDDYLVLSTDSSAVKKCYKTTDPKAFINMVSFPSMNNEDGVVAITTKSGEVIDLVAYTAAMQYPLLTSVDGVSLERINPERASDDATNWHSAAESAGFGTPGYKNSQFGVTVTDENEITLSPDIFSPDNDGYNDYLNIAYSFGAPGNNISITIYDATGHLICNLVNHELCGTSGAFAWDGITDERTKALIGRYIVFVEVFDMDGNVKKYKKGTVLGGKL
jgi:hypothetical protein